MPLPHPIPDELIERIARRFQLLAEPMRLRLLDRLWDGEATVQELADELETSQQNVSKHLSLLAEAAIVARRKDGTHVRYRIADDEAVALCAQMSASVEHQLLGLAALVDGFGTRPVRLNPHYRE